MYRRPSKKKETTMRVITYIAMTFSVVGIVGVLIFLILGYRLDTDSGRIEQGALVQFDTIPAGATVKIDGKTLGTKTSTKSTVLAGTHTFVMERDGYETWQKTLDIKAGTLTWLDYGRLVPKNRNAESVAAYPTVYGSIASDDGKTILVQQVSAVPSYQLVDIRSDDVKSSTIVIPATAYSEATTAGVTHAFTMTQWDTGGRYMLIQHTYGDKKEWLVLDTRDVNATKNVTKLLDLDINQIVFSGTNGNILYALSAGDIRKLDLSAGTISRSLVTNASSFELYETNIITYVGVDPSDAKKTVVGLYREGDSATHVLRSVTTTDVPLRIATSRYFNKEYVVITEGGKVDILSGTYPTQGSDNSSLTQFASFTFSENVGTVSFSPKGDYVLVQSGAHFASYDIEHQRISDYIVPTEPGATVGPVRWLDQDHTISDYGGNVIMRDFDGENAVVINKAVSGQATVLTQNDRYIYSFGTSASGLQLQRVRMVLP